MTARCPRNTTFALVQQAKAACPPLPPAAGGPIARQALHTGCRRSERDRPAAGARQRGWTHRSKPGPILLGATDHAPCRPKTGLRIDRKAPCRRSYRLYPLHPNDLLWSDPDILGSSNQ